MITSNNGKVTLFGENDDLVCECATICVSVYRKIARTSEEDADKFLEERLPILIGLVKCIKDIEDSIEDDDSTDDECCEEASDCEEESDCECGL